jgi:hypothetical protein
VALLAYVKLLRRPDLRWAILLGVALGFGLLAKYAMGYFLLCAALAAVVDADARAWWRRPQAWLALGIAALILAPNVYWNVENGFVTFRHTGENIQGGGLQLNPLKALEFVAAQFAVFGPVVFAVLLVLFGRWKSAALTPADRLMLAFALPPLLLVTVVGLFRSPHANWAAPAFISAAVVVTAVLVRRRQWGWLKAGLAIGVAVQAVLLVGDALADRIALPLLRKGDVYERTLGWRALGQETDRLAQAAGARTVATERRDDMASLLYYLRDKGVAVRNWPRRLEPDNHFAISHPLAQQDAAPVLLVTRCAKPEGLDRDYATVTPLGGFAATSGPNSARQYYAYALSGPRGAIRPLGGC